MTGISLLDNATPGFIPCLVGQPDREISFPEKVWNITSNIADDIFFLCKAAIIYCKIVIAVLRGGSDWSEKLEPLALESKLRQIVAGKSYSTYNRPRIKWVLSQMRVLKENSQYRENNLNIFERNLKECKKTFELLKDLKWDFRRSLPHKWAIIEAVANLAEEVRKLSYGSSAPLQSHLAIPTNEELEKCDAGDELIPKLEKIFEIIQQKFALTKSAHANFVTNREDPFLGGRGIYEYWYASTRRIMAESVDLAQKETQLLFHVNPSILEMVEALRKNAMFHLKDASAWEIYLKELRYYEVAVSIAFGYMKHSPVKVIALLKFGGFSENHISGKLRQLPPSRFPGFWAIIDDRYDPPLARRVQRLTDDRCAVIDHITCRVTFGYLKKVGSDWYHITKKKGQSPGKVDASNSPALQKSIYKELIQLAPENYGIIIAHQFAREFAPFGLQPYYFLESEEDFSKMLAGALSIGQELAEGLADTHRGWPTDVNQLGKYLSFINLLANLLAMAWYFDYLGMGKQTERPQKITETITNLLKHLTQVWDIGNVAHLLTESLNSFCSELEESFLAMSKQMRDTFLQALETYNDRLEGLVTEAIPASELLTFQNALEKTMRNMKRWSLPLTMYALKHSLWKDRFSSYVINEVASSDRLSYLMLAGSPVANSSWKLLGNTPLLGAILERYTANTPELLLFLDYLGRQILFANGGAANWVQGLMDDIAKTKKEIPLDKKKLKDLIEAEKGILRINDRLCAIYAGFSPRMRNICFPRYTLIQDEKNRRYLLSYQPPADPLNSQFMNILQSRSKLVNCTGWKI